METSKGQSILVMMGDNAEVDWICTGVHSRRYGGSGAQFILQMELDGN